MEKQGREMSGYGEGNCSEKPGRRSAERGSAWARGSIDSRRKAKAKESGEQRSERGEKKGNGKETGMSKYIEADKLRDGVMQFVNEYGEIVGMFVTDFNILVERCGADVVKRVHRGRRPSDDLVEVVRCRECKYYIEREDGYICANDYLYKDSDWFCADGERNE